MCVVEHPEEVDRNPCKIPDMFFGLAWIASVITMIVVAFEYGWTEVGSVDYDDDDSKKKHAVKGMVKIFVLAFLFALVLSQLAMCVMMRFGGTMIHVAMFICEALLATCGVIAINIHERWFVGTVFFGLFALLVAFHFFSLTRIRYAAVTLHVGTEIVLAYPLLQVTAFLMAVIAVLFILIFALAIFGYYNYQDNGSGNASNTEIVVVLVIFIFIFFWSQQIFKYILSATTGGTAYSWWYGHLPSITDHPAINALGRNLTYNLGSICFGAFFVAFVETIIVVVQYLKKKAKQYPGGRCISCLLGCVQCCLGCCAAIMDYVNKYAFSYVGIYGYSYLYAGKKVVDLFSHHGFAVIGADFFIDMVLFLNHIIIGIVTAAFGVMLVQKGPDEWSEHTKNAPVAAGIVCGIAGLAISGIIFSVLDGANKATMILFSDNPHVLEVTHPDEFALISKSWAMLGEEIKDEAKDDDAS